MNLKNILKEIYSTIKQLLLISGIVFLVGVGFGFGAYTHLKSKGVVIACLSGLELK